MEVTMSGVVEFFVVDETFLSGHVSFGINHLYQELKAKFPKYYIRNCSHELQFRKFLSNKLDDNTIGEIVSLLREEITIDGYWMRFCHLRFVPVSGFWLTYS